MAGVPVDIDKPLWDQRTFYGRFQHFLRITNPLLSLKSEQELEKAADLVKVARSTGLVPNGVSLDELQTAKVLYDSAYHPDSGERMNLIGRMSFQVPGGMVILGSMLVYYRTTLQVFMVQWVNQSFNALVNYTNRNVNSSITNRQIGVAYAGATTGAVGVSVLLNSLVKRAPPLVARWVPFVAVAAANCINIPTMRQRELVEGVGLSRNDFTGKREEDELGRSRVAAVKGISQVTFSRIFMTIPTLLMLPVLSTRLERRYPLLMRNNIAAAGLQTLFCGILLCFAVPVGCALFPQRSSISYDWLEKEAQLQIKNNTDSVPKILYFNKGL
ncbi:PREDICTED: sideroflexin-2-like [Amphimedon queenslandica]|uniref:Sidoreflexin n=1 Tax=Amphimedon queenslandica TaxID=400682 RepID=A0A1X7VLF1_AMPQE|nr:PREDICTED: sideroflexin-2-like [Amphimedon queenslandica]|eukprot:XP_003383928.1 PREDICTED: sideroflexin-2-like [Amphimedon queenslandica]